VGKHSATPWQVGYDGPSRPIISTADHKLLSISQLTAPGRHDSYDTEDADAELIVRAVNAHEALVLATTEALERFNELKAAEPLHDYFDEPIRKRLENALRLARGEG
jgi:hypothetical protein